MAEFDNNMDLAVKTRPSPKSSPTSSATSFFHRSFTIQSARATPKPYVPSPSRFTSSFESMKGKVRVLRNMFEASRAPKVKPDESQQQSHIKLVSHKSMGADHNRYSYIFSGKWVPLLPGTEDRIVVYFTSLRGVRRTFDDCYTVRRTFRQFRVWVDERDISMDTAYKKELHSVFGEKGVTLPQVFIRGRHVGGADDIHQLLETGELTKLLDGFPRREPGYVCQGCGDARFVTCGFCNGSRKIFDDEEEFSKRCLACNENGLMRCPECCS
ncbi:unnamed protein product [Linum tenue]|uniref:Glutaredoxin domain-containing protein n=2 Tax=Linum tenue TaxID=586396 RepID=A0AAV0NSY8_9ROSI|nr:unnamed protein product [Linum tenue]